MGGWLLPTRLTSCVCCLALLMFSPFHSARMARRSISGFGRFVSIAALCVHRCTRATFGLTFSDASRHPSREGLFAASTEV